MLEEFYSNRRIVLNENFSCIIAYFGFLLTNLLYYNLNKNVLKKIKNINENVILVTNLLIRVIFREFFGF
ncbi:hypothetical protein LNA01_27010 [Companilactobacillus nantensis]|nr:hypothetical protein LNA01_27010 [Companilactobacillus nantensis]